MAKPKRKYQVYTAYYFYSEEYEEFIAKKLPSMTPTSRRCQHGARHKDCYFIRAEEV